MATKSEMAPLTGKINMLDTEIKSLNNNFTTQMKSFIETVSAQISVLTANMNTNIESKLDKFENRFLFRMLFAVFSVTVVGAAASYLRSQTPVIQTPATQTPAVQTSAAQAPAVRQN